MATTTIPIEPSIRDRLRGFGAAGQTYNDILTRMMDQIEKERFLAELQRERDEPGVNLDDLQWE